jgi:hypothetical protein
MKRWRLPLVLSAVALTATAALFAVTKASASADHHRLASRPTSSSGCAKLMSDQTANAPMQQLHREHASDMQAWRDTYGSDPTSLPARQALADVRKTHAADMRAQFDKLGIKVPAGLCDGDMMSGSSAGMMGDPATGSSIHDQHHNGQTAAPGDMMGGGSGSMMSDGSGGMMGGSSL